MFDNQLILANVAFGSRKPAGAVLAHQNDNADTISLLLNYFMFLLTFYTPDYKTVSPALPFLCNAAKYR